MHFVTMYVGSEVALVQSLLLPQRWVHLLPQHTKFMSVYLADQVTYLWVYFEFITRVAHISAIVSFLLDAKKL